MSTFGFTSVFRHRFLVPHPWLVSGFVSLCSLIVVPLLPEAAIAQSLSADTLRNYAQALLEIEPIRQSAYGEIKRILGTDQVPPIYCHRRESLDRLSANIRQIAINYCRDASRIAQRNDLTSEQFNAITQALQSNPDLMQRIEQEMIRLQQGSPR